MSRQHRVLVVDDDDAVLDLICEILQQAGAYDISRASSGAEALKLVKRIHPDLILLDIQMPGMSGLDVVRVLRSREESKLLPVVMLTGASNECKTEALDAGADDFLRKGDIVNGELRARVQSSLRVKIVQDERDAKALEIKSLNQELSVKNEMLEQFHQRLHRDLEMARGIQQALLPQTKFEMDGLQLETRYWPCDEVGGDFIDYLAPDPSHLNLVLADVSGHGLPAALIVSLMKSLCYRELRDAVEPPQFLLKLNDLLHSAMTEHQYATACCVQYDAAARELIYSNGGHPAFLVHHRGNGGEIEMIRQPGPLLGLLKTPRFDRVKCLLHRGDRVFFYTDGLVDLRSPSLETFDLNRVRDTLTETRDASLADCLDHFEDATRRFGAEETRIDDVALVGMDIL